MVGVTDRETPPMPAAQGGPPAPDGPRRPPIPAQRQQPARPLTGRVVPSHSDPIVRSASTLIGGPWGRHGVIGRQWFWTPLRVLLAFTIFTLLLGWVQKAPCQDGNWTLKQQVADSQGNKTYVLGKEYVWMCYSDVIPLYGGKGLDQQKLPYKNENPDQRMEYPVLTGFFMYAASEVAHWYDKTAEGVSGLPHPPPVETYWQVTVLMLAICAFLVVWAVSRLARRRVWDAAMVALSPVLFLHAFTNWDLFAVALATGGMLAWSRRKHGLAGVLIGLGTAAKFYPLFLLGPLLVLCLRAKKMREFGITLLTAIIAWLAVNLPVALAWPTSWKQFYTMNSDRPADPDTLWNVGQQLAGGITIGKTEINAATLLSFFIVCVGVAALGILAPRRPRIPQLAFLLVAGFLLVNKVWSPQYSLWLVPLAVLARPSWRTYIAWQLVEVLLWFPRMYWFLQTQQQGYADQGYRVLVRGLPQSWFLFVVVVRDLLVILYGVLIVRDVLSPHRDVVRSDGVDDPAGGVLDGASDAWRRPRIARGAARNTT